MIGIVAVGINNWGRRIASLQLCSLQLELEFLNLLAQKWQFDLNAPHAPLVP
eukprot:jgi/Phyca11/509852/fgenesh2_kg.PHYCAscaffold_50_\